MGSFQGRCIAVETCVSGCETLRTKAFWERSSSFKEQKRVVTETGRRVECGTRNGDLRNVPQHFIADCTIIRQNWCATGELVSGWNEVFAVSWNEALNEMKFSRQGNMGGSAIPAIATHVARWVTKQLTSSHRAKEKMEQDGIKATKAKDQAKVEQRDSRKAKAKE